MSTTADINTLIALLFGGFSGLSLQRPSCNINVMEVVHMSSNVNYLLVAK